MGQVLPGQAKAESGRRVPVRLIVLAEQGRQVRSRDYDNVLSAILYLAGRAEVE
jgi:hypothetical protein